MDILHLLTLNNILVDRILAIIAIIAGVVAIYYERRLHELFKLQDVKIENIVLSVHTRYIGPFPGDINKATELVASADKSDELLILVDYLGYGHYSSPEQFAIYAKALSGTQAKVRMLVYGEACAKESLQAQFKRKEFDSGIKVRPSFRHYVDYYSKILKHEPTTYEEFLNSLVITQDHFSRILTLTQNIEVRAISNSSINEAVFFWMVPQKEMVFSFPNFYFEQKGFAFKSRDSHFMEIFLAQFSAKWEEGTLIEGNMYSSQKLF